MLKYLILFISLLFTTHIYAQGSSPLIPEECKKIIEPLLKQKNMTLTDMQDPAKVSEFKQSISNPVTWNKIGSVCAPAQKMLGSYICTCGTCRGDCGFFGGCTYRCTGNCCTNFCNNNACKVIW